MLSFMHLTVFEAIMRTKSVSLAAETLDVPQPTLSRYLKQLRDHFGNQLFVRTRTGLEPTSIAISSAPAVSQRSEEHTSELHSLMRISYAVFCLKKKKKKQQTTKHIQKTL